MSARCWKGLGVIGMLLMASCGGGGGEGAAESGAPETTAPVSLSGIVKGINGDPLPFAALYIDGSAPAGSAVSPTKAKFASEEPCRASIPVGALTGTCTDAMGRFEMPLPSDIADGVFVVKVRKGSLSSALRVTCAPTARCTLGPQDSQLRAANTAMPRIAVVTGAFDSIESVLAKIGDADLGDAESGVYGRVGQDGRYIYGSEFFGNIRRLTVLAGDGATGGTGPVGAVQYNLWDDYLTGKRDLVLADGTLAFDMVLINCGDAYQFRLINQDVRSRLRAYLEAGGRLFATDLAYDFIEQSVPEGAVFRGDVEGQRSALDAAEHGHSGLEIRASIRMDALREWLSTVSANSNDGLTPGFPRGGGPGGVVGTAVLDNSVPIGDFEDTWALVEEGGVSTEVLIDSGGTVVEGRPTRPLAFVRSVGAKGGTVIFTSYHTAALAPSTGFWPQERVLQFLILIAT